MSINGDRITLTWLALVLLVALGYIAGNYVALRHWNKVRQATEAHYAAGLAREEARGDTLAKVVETLTNRAAATPATAEESSERTTPGGPSSPAE